MFQEVFSLVSTWERTVYENDGNSYVDCHKCGNGFKSGDVMVRHRRSGGRTRAYHKKCYERLYQ